MAGYKNREWGQGLTEREREALGIRYNAHPDFLAPFWALGGRYGVSTTYGREIVLDALYKLHAYHYWRSVGKSLYPQEAADLEELGEEGRLFWGQQWDAFIASDYWMWQAAMGE